MRREKPVQVMVEKRCMGAPPDTSPSPTPRCTCSAADFKPELAEILYRSLGQWLGLGSGQLESELRALEKRYRDPSTRSSSTCCPTSGSRQPGEKPLAGDRPAPPRAGAEARIVSWTRGWRSRPTFVHVNRKIQNPRIVELQLFEQSRTYAYRDELTSLPNHRFFVESLDREMLRARRSNQPMSLVMATSTTSGATNERHGHRAGDVGPDRGGAPAHGVAARRESFARTAAEEIRAGSLRPTPKIGAQLVAERTRAAIEARGHPPRRARSRMHHRQHGDRHPRVTPMTPAGWSGAPTARSTWPKSGGKNQVAIHGGNRRFLQPRGRAPAGAVPAPVPLRPRSPR